MADSMNRDDLMEQVKQQIALVNAQELLSVWPLFIIPSIIPAIEQDVLNSLLSIYRKWRISVLKSAL